MFNIPYNKGEFSICVYFIFYCITIVLSDNFLSAKFCYQNKSMYFMLHCIVTDLNINFSSANFGAVIRNL